MVRLIILLIGAQAFRARWKALMALGAACLLAGAASVLGITDWYLFDLIDVFGVIFLIEGLVALIEIARQPGRYGGAIALHAVAMLVLGFLAIDIPWDNNIASTVLFGAAFLVDGLLRIAAALVIRFRAWGGSLAMGVAELVVAALIWTDWPVPHRLTFPFVVGLALLVSGWILLRLAREFRQLPAGASVTSMPFFSAQNWHWRDTLPTFAVTPPPDTGRELNVYVWTPTGSASDPQRRLVVDRYIAAVDGRGRISTGHAAMELLPDLYISLYPAAEIDRSPGEFQTILRADAGNDVPGRFLPSHPEEVAAWCAPDQLVVFRHFNPAALQAFWEAYRQDATYNLTSRNCSSTVALALDAALEGVVGRQKPWYRFFLLVTDPNLWLLAVLRARAESMTWTPGLVLDYARVLRRVSECQGERWLVRRLNSLRWGRRATGAERGPEGG
ncbi:hypothetical protein UB46_03065 [Burkholderiaceae bacterium 16]|nr:hypothetical protein UB46_03065 [Burkholderiaceae bacterium 16]